MSFKKFIRESLYILGCSGAVAVIAKLVWDKMGIEYRPFTVVLMSLVVFLALKINKTI